MTIMVTHATPMPALVKRRADSISMLRWDRRLLEIRTCQHCKTTYVTAGDAGHCEKYHEGLLGL